MVALVALENRPGLHSMQDETPTLPDHWPAGQTVQDDAPAWLYSPWLQFEHVEMVVAPTAAEYVPAEH